MQTDTSLPILLVEPIVRAALLEDLGRAGDITSDALLPAGAACAGAIVALQRGTIAGTEAAALAFRLLDPAVRIAIDRPDGSEVEVGEAVMRVDGPARAVLAAERVALNLLCHLSGIATVTAARPHHARITCTRKTTPGLRALEKQAVRAGGGVNHRFGLDDGVLIKDNHIALAGGVGEAIARARRAGGRPHGEGRVRGRGPGPAAEGARGRGRRGPARQHDTDDAARRGRGDRRPGHRRSLRPHHDRNYSGCHSQRRRPDLGRLDHTQRRDP